MRFRRMRYAIWLPLAAKAVACLGVAGATKPLAATAKMARETALSMVLSNAGRSFAPRALRAALNAVSLSRRCACSRCRPPRPVEQSCRARVKSTRLPEWPRFPTGRAESRPRGARPRGTSLHWSCAVLRPPLPTADRNTKILTPPPPAATASHTPRRLSAAASPSG